MNSRNLPQKYFILLSLDPDIPKIGRNILNYQFTYLRFSLLQKV